MPEGILRFELRVALRGRLPAGGALAFGALAAAMTVLGLSTFRTVGLSQVTPSAIAILNVALLVPTAVALVAGAVSVQRDRDGGMLAMLRAAGVGTREIAVGKVASTAAVALALVLAGFAAAALVGAGALTRGDVGAFLGVLAASALAALVAAAIGVLVGTLPVGRSQAAVLAMAAWLVLALGLDLFMLSLGPALRAGVPAMLGLLVLDPFDSARTLGLLALGADAQLLGPTGALLLDGLGAPRASALLGALLLLWSVVCTVAAAAALRRGESR